MKTDYQVGIIGAGFAGLVAATHLRKAGKNSFVILERASEIGGTWRDNVYPGCACDVVSYVYSIASEPNPDWSHQYSKQPEILQYLKNVVAKNDLEPHISFETDIVKAEFIEKDGYWQLTDQHGYQTRVRLLISAIGPLNRPVIPPFKGLDTFKGKAFHSSQWDTTCDLKNKRVAVIGTGASAIQIVPNIVDVVVQLNVFQRTAAWVAPRFDRKISGFEKTLFKYLPFTQKAFREGFYWLNEFFGKAFLGNMRVYKINEYLITQKLKKEVHDPVARQKLTPQYAIGCKRILVSDDYLPTFNRPNVNLVTEAIDYITEDSIITKDGQVHPVDIIVLATGFEAANVDIYTKIFNQHGINLIDEWQKKGVEAYRGTTIANFPNLAFLLGPNTGLGHNSVIHMMESQMTYILQYLDILEKNGFEAYLELKPEVQKKYNENLQKQFDGTVWASGCDSWYFNKFGKITTLYPRLTAQFRRETKRLNVEDYQIFNKK